MFDEATVRATKRLCERDLLANENVVGVGVGYKEVGGRRTNELCIVVSVVRKGTFRAKDRIPSTLGSVPTDVQETGRFRALRMGRHRPAPGGVSIGHTAVTAGTLGCLVRSGGSGSGSEVFILSNNHVLADSNRAVPGDPIVQPGTYDGGDAPDDVIAKLEEYVPVKFLLDNLPDCPVASGVAKAVNLSARLARSKHRIRAYQDDPLAFNLVDAAIARPLDASLVEDLILEIGTPNGIAEGVLGLPIVKSGRTTGFTTGEITQIDATVQVSYGSAGIAVFEDQLMAGDMCAGGDSGSAVLDNENRVVGLLFAGGEGITIFNRIQNVMSALDVAI